MCNSRDMATCDLPDMCALSQLATGPKAEGIHVYVCIEQILIPTLQVICIISVY